MYETFDIVTEDLLRYVTNLSSSQIINCDRYGTDASAADPSQKYRYIIQFLNRNVVPPCNRVVHNRVVFIYIYFFIKKSKLRSFYMTTETREDIMVIHRRIRIYGVQNIYDREARSASERISRSGKRIPLTYESLRAT